MNTRDLRGHLAGGGVAFFDLSSRAKFRFTGADRVRYLNGQVSNDVRRLSTERDAALPACVMTAKGKMNALVWIAALAEEIRLDADASLRETLAGRLERYIISDDVTLEDATDEERLLHLLGASWEFVDSLRGASAGVESFRSRRFGMEGVDLMGPPEAMAHLGLPAAVLPVDAETAETFRIEQGIPRWDYELNENTLPAEAGLDAFAIDFHKGCYIGQEVISRIKSVGHVNRRLCGFVADAPLQPGTPLFAGDKEAGILTSAAWSFALDKAVALGYLKRGMETPTLRAGSGIVDVRELPLIS